MRPAALRWTGAVLCGGRSTRMGHDKATLLVDGVPMVRRVSDALRAAGAHRIVTVGGGVAAVELGDDVRVVGDRWPGEGPLGGIVTALDAVDDEVEIVLVVACDLLDPSPSAMAAVVGALGAAHDHDVAVPVGGGRRQWLHAAWRRSAGSRLADAFTQGARAVHRGVAAAGLAVVELHDVHAGALADADTPAALQAAGVTWGTLPGMDSPEVPEIDVAELARLRAEGDVRLVDVREPDEYDEAHVPGATLIPVGTVPERLDEVPTDGPVYVICAKGGRSYRAAEFYRSKGIEAVNIAGGTSAWVDAGESTATGMDP
jgi:molybdopterin-guanine dinucleotide biosynthesis protein A/rhodanese-related sulfurtransferase